MAPKRKITQSDELAAAATTMVTRSSTRRATRNSAKATPTKSSPSVASPQPRKKNRKAKTSAKKDEKSPAAKTNPADKPVPEGSKTIIIEHCKQCNSFKTRAVQVKNGLESGVAGVNVVVNPEKPRKGCFEIREEGGEVFVSLLDMKRPFSPMKALNMDKVISDIIDKIK